MLFVTAKFRVRPEYADKFPELVRAVTEASRKEPGCLWYEWSRSLDDPTEYVVVEAFRDGDAAGSHVASDHFHAVRRELPQYLQETPLIVSCAVPQDGWTEIEEFRIPHA